MLYNLKSVKEADVRNKTVLLRADLDVPIFQSMINDDTRLNAWFPTLQYLLENKAKVIIVGHLGRPEGIDEKFSLKPVADWIATRLQSAVSEETIGEFKAWRLTVDVSILENVRFYKEEEENSLDFAKKLALLAQIYVNDAFASSHRSHASIVAITKFLPSFAGLRLLEEVTILSGVLENPERPLCVIIGGAKIETKLPLVRKMCKFADFVLAGGKIVDDTELVSELNKEKSQNCSLLLAQLNDDKNDTTISSVNEFIEAAEKAKTIVWNGPLGKIEEEEYQKGTKILAEGLVQISAYTVVGGGDTVGFLRKINLTDKFSFVSTGGGAMLEFLSGDKLPGLTALEQK